MPELADWDSFYVIVGSAAGGLIGLQFVVLTLIAQRLPPRAAEGGAAFSTPTVVHFATVLPLAAYVTLTLSAFAAPSHPRDALFGVGTAALLLLFVGIHNAWDAVVYHVFVNMSKPDN